MMEPIVIGLRHPRKSGSTSRKQAVPASLLSRIVIETPCHESWENMSGDARKRHCASCNKSVHNLSEMSSEDALKLLGAGKPICVRLYRRPDGTVLTKECGSGKRTRWRGYAVMSAAACALLSLVGLKGAIAQGAPEDTPPPGSDNDQRFIRGEVDMTHTMGGIVPDFNQRIDNGQSSSSSSSSSESVPEGASFIMGEVADVPKEPELLLGKVAASPPPTEAD